MNRKDKNLALELIVGLNFKNKEAKIQFLLEAILSIADIKKDMYQAFATNQNESSAQLVLFGGHYDNIKQ